MKIVSIILVCNSMSTYTSIVNRRKCGVFQYTSTYLHCITSSAPPIAITNLGFTVNAKMVS